MLPPKGSRLWRRLRFAVLCLRRCSHRSHRGCLCCLLLIGLFFGRLTPLQGSCFAAIPLVTALPLRPEHAESRSRRQIVIRTALTALLCSLLLYQAWSVFAVRMLPLLAVSQHLSEQP